MKERMKEAKEEVETEQQNKLDISSGAWYNLSVYFFISWNFKATVKRFLHREGWGWSEVLCLGCGGREQGEGEETVSQEFWSTPFSFCFTWIPPPHFWCKGYSVNGFFQFLLFVSTAQVLPNSKQSSLPAILLDSLPSQALYCWPLLTIHEWLFLFHGHQMDTDLTRQYKTMQSEMALRIHMLEQTVNKLREQLGEFQWLTSTGN